MGIALSFYSVSDENIVRLHSSPPLIWRLIAPDSDEFYLDELGVGKKPGWIKRLLGVKVVQAPKEIPNLTFVAGWIGDRLHET